MLHNKMEGERNISKQIKANKKKKRKKIYTKTKNKITNNKGRLITTTHAHTRKRTQYIHAFKCIEKKKNNFTSK